MGIVDRVAKISKWQWIASLAIICAIIWFVECLPSQSASNAQQGNDRADEIKLSIVCGDFKCEVSKEKPQTEGYEPCKWSYFCGPDATIVSYFYRTVADPVALFTGLLFVATGLLWIATRQILKEAGESSRLQMKSYLFLSPDSFNLPLGQNFPRPFSITFKAINYGKAPSLLKESRYAIYYPRLGTPQLLNFERDALTIPHEFMVIPKGEQFVWLGANIPDRATFDEILKGDTSIQILGWSV